MNIFADLQKNIENSEVSLESYSEFMKKFNELQYLLKYLNFIKFRCLDIYEEKTIGEKKLKVLNDRLISFTNSIFFYFAANLE